MTNVLPYANFCENKNAHQCQRRRQISRVKNIDSVFQLSGVAFRLAPPYGGLLVGVWESLAAEVQTFQIGVCDLDLENELRVQGYKDIFMRGLKY